jgi:hypothetical protein
MKRVTVLLIIIAVLLTACGIYDTPKVPEVTDEPDITTTTLLPITTTTPEKTTTATTAAPPVIIAIPYETRQETWGGSVSVTIYITADYEYITPNNRVTIIKYIGDEVNVVIPSEINGLPVKNIRRGAFQGTDVVSVVIPDSVTEIGEGAFGQCDSLISVFIPDSVTEIGFSAFKDCISLTDIVLPSGLKRINMSTFANCSSLEHIVIPSSVTEIGRSAFSGCTALTEIELPPGLNKIGDHAFNGCTSLTEITIPSRIETIEEGTFSYCASLKYLYLPSGIGEISTYAFTGSENITITFRDKLYAYDDIIDIHRLLRYGAETVEKWEQASGFDVSELHLIFDKTDTLVISLDGTVTKVDFTGLEGHAPGIEEHRIFLRRRSQRMMETINNDNAPVFARVDEIPADIIEAAAALKPVILDIFEGEGWGITPTFTSPAYIIVGTGENRQIIQVSQPHVISSDNMVNELALRMWEWHCQVICHNQCDI